MRQARRNEDARRRAEEESRLTAEAHRRAEQDARLEAQRQRRADEEARIAAEVEAWHRTEEESRRETEAEALRLAGEQARLAAEAEARHRADEEARVAANREAQRRAEDEAHLKAEEARVAAEAEVRHRTEEESRRETEAEALRLAREQARLAAEAEARQRAQAEARLNAEADACRKAEEETRRQAEDDARLALPTTAPVADSMAGDLATPTIPDAPLAPIRAPHQYQPVARVPVVRAAPRPPVSASLERETRDRALSIDVRLVFEKAGFCKVSLLPRRDSGMPVEFAVLGSGDPPEFLALQEGWYQDVVLPNVGHLLAEGVEWAGVLSVDQEARWSLSGREIYVLTRHSELNGFVSAPRLILGAEHVVLCVAERLGEVRAAIALTGSPEPTLLNSVSGIPAGWAGLRGVVPRMPIAPSPTGDILDALRPLAEVEIALEGGIRIDRQTWLSGFPPSIRLRGDTSTIGALMIDGHDAVLSADGGYAVPGWDSPGEHSVWCTSNSRTYAIRSGAEDWELWDAYIWTIWKTLRRRHTVTSHAICGVLVRPPRVASSDGRGIVVPASNPVLIGAAPGEIEICTSRSDIRAGLCVGFPWFEPVWAIPAIVRRRDNRTAHVLLIGPPRPVAEGEQQLSMNVAGRSLFHRGRSWGGNAWCTAIITARRKGLETEPSRAEIADLWKTYERRAKALRRSWR